MTRQQIHFIRNEPRLTKDFKTGVSLHSHTDRSREGLGCLPRYAERNAPLAFLVDGLARKYEGIIGRELDFKSSYFIPPLAPGAAYAVESGQIEALGLRPIVSITDHDTIAGTGQILPCIDSGRAPISLEWTVPFGSAFFHVGVHNLPVGVAHEIVDGLLNVQCAYCRAAGIGCVGGHDPRCFLPVREWMDCVASIPDTLLVLNHPLWDIGGLGGSEHRSLLLSFLETYEGYLHALELNGLRSWSENRSVIVLAEEAGIPLISGGDRHGMEPNAVLNLTGAETFADFALEIRSGEPSVIVFLRQYEQPLIFRKIRTVWDVLASNPAATGGVVRWPDRICLPWADGRVLPLSSREWSAALAYESVEGPEAPECLPGNTMNGAEY